MRIAFYFLHFAGAGTERVILNQAKGLRARGHDVRLMLDWKVGEFLPLLPSDIPVSGAHSEGFLRFKKNIGALLRRALKRNAPIAEATPSSAPAPEAQIAEHQPSLANIIYTRCYGVYYTLCLMVFLLRHKPDALITAYGEWTTRALIAKWLLFSNVNLYSVVHLGRFKELPTFVFLYQKLTRLICISNASADSFRANHFPAAEKIVTIYNPVYDTTLFSSPFPVPQHPWFSQHDLPVLITAGRLEQGKNHALLLKALHEVLKQKKARLVILGEGSLHGSLEALAKELGIEEYVSFPGWVSNPYDYYSHSDAFVLSSNAEGLPTVLIEALGFGTPCISTDCPTGPAEILENGKYGILVPLHDEKAMAKAMLDTLEGKQSSTKESRIAQAKNFCIDKSIDAYLALLSKDLGR